MLPTGHKGAGPMRPSELPGTGIAATSSSGKLWNRMHSGSLGSPLLVLLWAESLESGSSAERHLCGSVVGPGQVGRKTSPGPPVRGSCPPSFGWGRPQSPGWSGRVTQAMLCFLDVESSVFCADVGACSQDDVWPGRASWDRGVPTLPESDPVAACWLGTQANHSSHKERTVRAGGPPISFPSGISPQMGEIRVSATLGLVLRGTGRPCISSWPLLTQVHWF